MARPSPAIGLKAKLLVAGAAILVGLGIAEVAARSILPTPPQLGREPQLRYQSDPDLGFFHVPGQSGYLDDGLATINDLGLRGRRPEVPKAEGSVRVLAIGDSTTFGWGVGDAETYTAQLEARLASAFPRQQPDVINAGVVSYNLKQSARLLQKFESTLSPDIVLVGLFWNDLPYESVSTEGAPIVSGPSAPASPATAGSPARRTFRMANQPSGLNWLLRQSRLVFALRHAWLGAIAPTAIAANQVQWEMALLDGRTSPAIDDAWRDLERTLIEIHSLAETGGFDVGVVIIPIRAQVEQSYPNAAYQTRVRSIAQKQGFFVIDPLPAFRAASDARSLFIPYDRMHLSPRGNALLADAVFDALRARPEFGGAR